MMQYDEVCPTQKKKKTLQVQWARISGEVDFQVGMWDQSIGWVCNVTMFSFNQKQFLLPCDPGWGQEIPPLFWRKYNSNNNNNNNKNKNKNNNNNNKKKKKNNNNNNLQGELPDFAGSLSTSLTMEALKSRESPAQVKRNITFQTIIFRFHVDLRGCRYIVMDQPAGCKKLSLFIPFSRDPTQISAWMNVFHQQNLVQGNKNSNLPVAAIISPCRTLPQKVLGFLNRPPPSELPFTDLLVTLRRGMNTSVELHHMTSWLTSCESMVQQMADLLRGW